jgi:hypothetical protein
MAPPESGPGEQRERAVRRRRLMIFAALAVVGGFSGFYVGFYEAQAFLDGGTAWSPTLALVLVALFLVAMIGGSILLKDSMDEVERFASYKAVAFAGAVYILVYPLWFLLWKGGFVGEPIHWVLFALFWLSLALSTLWYRFR